MFDRVDPYCSACEREVTDEWDNAPDPRERHQRYINYTCTETGKPCDIRTCPRKILVDKATGVG